MAVMSKKKCRKNNARELIKLQTEAALPSSHHPNPVRRFIA